MEDEGQAYEEFYESMNRPTHIGGSILDAMRREFDGTGLRITHPWAGRCRDQYQSPIERVMGEYLLATIRRDVKIKPQASPPGTVMRLDFMVEGAGVVFGVECDGREFHAGDNAERDKRRDVVARSHGVAVHRFPGKVIWRECCSCITILRERYPQVFNPFDRNVWDELKGWDRYRDDEVTIGRKRTK